MNTVLFLCKANYGWSVPPLSHEIGVSNSFPRDLHLLHKQEGSIDYQRFGRSGGIPVKFYNAGTA